MSDVTSQVWVGRFRRGFVIGWALFFGVLTILIAIEGILYATGHGWNDAIRNNVNMEIIRDHWAGLFVTPLLVVFSLLLVFITKIVSGPITFKLGGGEISGAASEGLMWIFFFLSLVWGFSELWNLPSSAMDVTKETSVTRPSP